jgi:hypothetical protein
MATDKYNKEIKKNGVTFRLSPGLALQSYNVGVKGEEYAFAGDLSSLRAVNAAITEYFAALELEADAAKIEAAKAFDLEVETAADEAEAAKYSDPLDMLFS